MLGTSVASRSLIGIAIAAVIAVGVTLVMVPRASAAKPEPWPSFTMVYRESLFGAQPQTQVFRITYSDSRHYTTELMENSLAPQAVGWTHVVDGTQSKTTDPRLGQISSTTWKPEDQVLPDYWLRPSAKPWFEGRAGTRTERLPDGLSRATNVSRLDDGRESVEELTYRDNDGIPTLFVERLEGKVIRQVDVLQLTVH